MNSTLPEKEPSLLQRFVTSMNDVMERQEKNIADISKNLSYQKQQLYRAYPIPVPETDAVKPAGLSEKQRINDPESLSGRLEEIVVRLTKINEAIVAQSNEINSNNSYLEKIL